MDKQEHTTMFTKEFNGYVCDGDRIECEIDGVRWRARVVHDPDYQIDDDDCHNEDQSVTGCDDEQYERLMAARKAWFDDQWWYGGVVLSKHTECEHCHETKDEDLVETLWGIEINYPGGDNKYLREVANELLQEAIANGE